MEIKIKKLLSFVCVMTLLFSIVGCSATSSNNTEEQDITVEEESKDEEKNTSEDTSQTESAEEKLAAWKDKVTSEGKTIVEGTMRYVSYNDLLQIQGKSDPNPGYGEYDRMYTVLVFDSPMMLNCQSGDGMGLREKEATLISITNYDGSSLDGQHVSAAIDSSTYYWPSDTSLPLGEPSGPDIEIYSEN